MRLMGVRSTPMPRIIAVASLVAPEAAAVHGVAHPAHRPLHAAEDGARDDGVADVELGDLADGGDGADVTVVEAVAGGDVQPELMAARGGAMQPRQLLVAGAVLDGVELLAVVAGVQ